LVATLVGEGQSEIRPGVDDTLEKFWPCRLKVLRLANLPSK